ncbi:molybdopterin-dependent oxidoreductase [Halotalea alkalilenta]|uniref:molybdopterin-dependent oxidoreductase n=1 Tax=Halotalea alkalilenta TaxID=376489 RepID=UPI000B0590AE|nr:molybdopterin-dependent oxidoreductase [Halotalea alkalilenta]
MSSISYMAFHWGLYEVENAMTDGVTVRPFHRDPAPSPIGLYAADPALSRARIRRPAVRRGWLEAKRGGRDDGFRGQDAFVEVEWDEALDLAASELDRVRGSFGNEAIFGGSYGWSSAGRFHHAQSQVHRFLNTIGGYVRHMDSYSLGAARALMPYLVAPMDRLMSEHTDWATMAAHTRLFLTFGGVPAKNAQISAGGTSAHRVPGGLRRMAEAGVRFVNVSPVRSDLDTGADFEWWPIRPNTDTALILGMCHTLLAENLYDRDFLKRYCVGFEVFRDYLDGTRDGEAKTADWAATITGLPAEEIRQLARDLYATRSMINMAWSLQRAHHGEQPFWALIALASMVGQIGLPGGGFGVCYGAENLMGSPHRRIKGPTLAQGDNPVGGFIPVARIADMLLHPGETFSYRGEDHSYPDIRLIYWAGGNPFHHHQDLNRLMRAWQKPETIIVNEIYWTPLAKAADIVFPATSPMERDDIFHATREPCVAAMKRAQPVYGEARDDYAIFSALAKRLGVADAFCEGRSASQWLRHLYENWRQQLIDDDIELPDFDTFWETGIIEFPQTGEPVVMLAGFRDDPQANALETPSGRIEIFSQRIAGYGYADCPGHPCWLPPQEYLGSPVAERYPLHLITDQPATRLHSQLDHSPNSLDSKISGREPIWIHPDDAAERGIVDASVVRVFNDRGSCLAGAVVTDAIRRGVAKLSTGAWFDPTKWSADGSLEKHGNPNVLTIDLPASAFSQGCSAQSCLVQIEAFLAPKPGLSAHLPPRGIENFTEPQ